MPFIKAKNGNVIELAPDLVQEFLTQGHTGPFDTAEEALAGASSASRATKPRRSSKRTKEASESKAPVTPDVVEEPKELEDADEADELDESEDADELEQEPAEDDESEGTGESEPAVERPGRGASQAAWAQYADATKVPYPAGSGRDEIRDLVEAAEARGASDGS